MSNAFKYEGQTQQPMYSNRVRIKQRISSIRVSAARSSKHVLHNSNVYILSVSTKHTNCMSTSPYVVLGAFSKFPLTTFDIRYNPPILFDLSSINTPHFLLRLLQSVIVVLCFTKLVQYKRFKRYVHSQYELDSTFSRVNNVVLELRTLSD